MCWFLKKNTGHCKKKPLKQNQKNYYLLLRQELTVKN